MQIFNLLWRSITVFFQAISLVWGIIAVLGMIVGFIPCIGALNWILIPFSGIGVIISAIALATAKGRYKGGCIGGLVCCGIALFFGIIRLIMGGGIL